MVILVSDHTTHCYSNADGDLIYKLLQKAFDDKEDVVLSFKGIDSVSTSFVNSAFIELLENFDMQFIKKHLKIIDSTRVINDVIKRRFDFEVNRRNKLIEV